jgi:hypothetical protein
VNRLIWVAALWSLGAGCVGLKADETPPPNGNEPPSNVTPGADAGGGEDAISPSVPANVPSLARVPDERVADDMVVEEDRTILDAKTGLRWQTEAPKTVEYIEGTSQRNCEQSRRQGKSGWRLPSALELLSIVDHSPQRRGFDSVWGASFGQNGRDKWLWSRDADLRELPKKLAWSISVDSSENPLPRDGALPFPLYYACVLGQPMVSAQLVASSDPNTVFDRAAKLEWRRKATTTTPINLAELNNDCTVYGAGFRYPSVKELFSLFDVEQGKSPFFSPLLEHPLGASSFHYWAAGPNVKTRTVSFAGGVGSSAGFVRCVRSFN